ncbi:unnamed protein product [Mytilus edulis]|uniref:Fibrinogen C-terminal domain-containing protein n=1 Tax=Mytilus edulis TaxID=6550 RepID=A0A8S3QDW0_MYTED|nr:unnamed protein product [Mytilus edulis]
MPLVSNELKAPLVADLDVSALNAELKDYIDDNIFSTFTEKIEDIVNKKLLGLKKGMLNEYSSKLEKSQTRCDQKLAELYSVYDNRFSDLSENQSENVTKFMENVQEWQTTLMQSVNEQSEYLQKSKIVYDNQVSEVLRNYKHQTSEISKEVVTSFTKLKTELKNWKNDMVDDVIKSVTSNLTQFETNMINEIHECSEKSKLVGIYNISPDESHAFNVRCETGGWTVIQKRFNGVTEFYRNWQDYENGFGDLNEEFWLGNKYIAMLTSEETIN